MGMATRVHQVARLITSYLGVFIGGTGCAEACPYLDIIYWAKFSVLDPGHSRKVRQISIPVKNV